MKFPHKLIECSPHSFEEVECSNEIMVCTEVSIPDPKPDVNQIIQLKHEVLIEDISRIPVKAPNGKIKGQKLLIRGILALCVEYSSDMPEQTVHVAHSHIPFDVLLIQDRECILHQLPLQVKVDPIWTEKMSSRRLENTTSLFFWLKREILCESQGCEPNDCTPSAHSPNFTSKHLSINKTISLPPQQPQISQILDQKFMVEIIKAEVRSTPLLSYCCKVPIRKVVVKGDVEILVKYESISTSQEVHAFTFNLPLCVLVEWVGGPPPYNPICLEIIPEHFQVDCLDVNQLFCVLLLRLDIYRQH